MKENGLRKRKLTPKIAGSVIPRRQKRLEASVLSSGFLVFHATATVAAASSRNCAVMIALDGVNGQHKQAVELQAEVEDVVNT